jgi:hypothetical protein
MNDSIITYLKSCQESVTENYAEEVISQPNLFPDYSNFSLPELKEILRDPIRLHIEAVGSGDFNEVKEAIYRVFSKRLQRGFHPNEMMRMADLSSALIVEAIQHAPSTDSERLNLYQKRSRAIAQVAKMYTAMLNLSLPEEERVLIEPDLLQLV